MPTETTRQSLFEQCVHLHADSLYRVAYRLTGHRDQADELVQETYCQAWSSIGSLRDVERMRGWIFSILRNQFAKMTRRISREQSLTPEASLAVVAPESAVDDQTGTEVRAALEQVDETYKFPLLLVSMEGLSVEEAAQVLEIPRGTVLSRLHRGRAKLKAILERELEIRTIEQLEKKQSKP